ITSIELVLRGRTRLTADQTALPSAGLIPDPARPERRDDLLLVAPGVAAHQDFAAVGVLDGKARISIGVRRAARHPTAAHLSPVEGLGNGFSGHGAPRRNR